MRLNYGQWKHRAGRHEVLIAERSQTGSGARTWLNFKHDLCLFVYSESSRLRKVQLKGQYTKCQLLSWRRGISWYWKHMVEQSSISSGDYDERQNPKDEEIPLSSVKCALAVISRCFLYGDLWPFPINRLFWAAAHGNYKQLQKKAVIITI